MKVLHKHFNQVINKTKTFLYHEHHKKEALLILHNIELEKGKTDSKILKLANEYAQDVLGGLKYAPWLRVYSAFCGKFKEGWIPSNYYGKIVVPKIKGYYGKLDDRKMICDLLVKPTKSLDLLYFTNNTFWTVDFRVCNKEHLKELLFKANKMVVYKTENSLQGRGIYFFDQTNFCLDRIKSLGNGVFQTYINQHPFFSEFTQNSVATIRLTTVCNNDNSISIRAAYLRLGKAKDTHVKSSSAIKIPINITNGKLTEHGYFPDWTSTKVHPDREVTFANKIIPQFNMCISEVKKMHQHIPFLGCVGWDVIVDSSNEIRLIEWNGNYNDIKFSEATQGPCFKDLNWTSLNSE